MRRPGCKDLQIGDYRPRLLTAITPRTAKPRIYRTPRAWEASIAARCVPLQGVLSTGSVLTADSRQPTPAPVETWDTINAIGLGGRGVPRPYTDLSPLIFLGVHIRRALRFFALGVSWHYPRGLAPTQIYRTYCAWDGASPPVAFLCRAPTPVATEFNPWGRSR